VNAALLLAGQLGRGQCQGRIAQIENHEEKDLGGPNELREFVNPRTFARCCGSPTRAPRFGQNALKLRPFGPVSFVFRRLFRKALAQEALRFECFWGGPKSNRPLALVWRKDDERVAGLHSKRLSV